MKVKNGSLDESQIPIMVNDYNGFLPFVDPNNMGMSQNNPLPQLLTGLNANPGLANLFPAYFAGDISGAQLSQQLFEKYASSLFKDMSYDVTVKLGKKSESDRILSAELSQALANGALGGNHPVDFTDSSSLFGAAMNSLGNGGEFMSTIKGMMGSGAGSAGTESSMAGSAPVSVGQFGLPATLDWKERSSEICEQISKRGMNPYEFGCLQDPDDVDKNFSFRGYAKMICSRLETVYDPGTPQLCGCPSATWSGWRP